MRLIIHNIKNVFAKVWFGHNTEKTIPVKMHLTVHDIMHVAANAYDLTIADLRSPRTSRVYSQPRTIAMWLAAELLVDKSLPQIGRCFGKHHTTIIHARNRARDMIGYDLGHIKKVKAIIAELTRVAKGG